MRQLCEREGTTELSWWARKIVKLKNSTYCIGDNSNASFCFRQLIHPLWSTECRLQQRTEVSLIISYYWKMQWLQHIGTVPKRRCCKQSTPTKRPHGAADLRALRNSGHKRPAREFHLCGNYNSFHFIPILMWEFQDPLVYGLRLFSDNTNTTLAWNVQKPNYSDYIFIPSARCPALCPYTVTLR